MQPKLTTSLRFRLTIGLSTRASAVEDLGGLGSGRERRQSTITAGPHSETCRHLLTEWWRSTHHAPETRWTGTRQTWHIDIWHPAEVVEDAPRDTHTHAHSARTLALAGHLHNGRSAG
eukprot:947538-Prorocentrum_minimum.AAC.4